MGMPVCAMILYRIRPRQPMSTSGTDCPKWGSANCLTLLVPLRDAGANRTPWDCFGGCILRRLEYGGNGKLSI
jgi:hypothetical protein